MESRDREEISHCDIATMDLLRSEELPIAQKRQKGPLTWRISTRNVVRRPKCRHVRVA
ncbi:hypothetical protein SAMCCGM7_Ch2130 [Sinorhizobium americanum CCGM7]|nr:hypothetical protein SAMCCGM7_Ch2130 [Sinorhizobium americanum CCGM7]